MARDQYDLVIVGGGMVGSAVALGLADTGLRIALIEHARPEPFDPDQPPDLRVSALSPASISLLGKLDSWQQIQNWRSCPYRRMRVWELDQEVSPLASNCVTEFNADETDLPYLGYIVENRLVQLALLEQIAQAASIDLIEEGVSSIDYSPGASLIELESGKVLNARLMVAADGGQSIVRDAVGIGTHSWDYEQSALVINVEIDEPQLDITWQQFTPDGPRALLPLAGSFASLVWYDQAPQVRYLSSLSDDQLLAEIHAHFPNCLPQIKGVTGCGGFPLRRMHAQNYWKPGVVLVGDSAHQINPLAGQGVNLGFQDAQALIEMIQEAVTEGTAFDAAELLQQYEEQRRRPNLAMMQTMDLFYRVFSNDTQPLKLVRNLALGIGGLATPLRRQVMRIASGLN